MKALLIFPIHQHLKLRSELLECTHTCWITRSKIFDWNDLLVDRWHHNYRYISAVALFHNTLNHTVSRDAVIGHCQKSDLIVFNMRR